MKAAPERFGKWFPTAARRLAPVLAAPLLAGCFGDPPEPPEIQPLEIIAGSSTMPDEPCMLNVDEVGAGTHDVILIAQRGPATARIRSANGEIVYERKSPGEAPPTSESEDGEIEITQPFPPDAVELAAGRYEVECELASGDSGAVRLEVVPARPEFDPANPYG